MSISHRKLTMYPNFHRLLVAFTCCCVVLAIALLHPQASRSPAAPDQRETTNKVCPRQESHPSLPGPTGVPPLPLSHDSTKTFGQLPVYFEPNQGQRDPRVKFIVHSGGATTFLTGTGAVSSLPIAYFQLPNGEQFSEEIASGAPTFRDLTHLGFPALSLRSANSTLDP